jgi:hypothetical protein
LIVSQGGHSDHTLSRSSLPGERDLDVQHAKKRLCPS